MSTRRIVTNGDTTQDAVRDLHLCAPFSVSIVDVDHLDSGVSNPTRILLSKFGARFKGEGDEIEGSGSCRSGSVASMSRWVLSSVLARRRPRGECLRLGLADIRLTFTFEPDVRRNIPLGGRWEILFPRILRPRGGAKRDPPAVFLLSYTRQDAGTNKQTNTNWMGQE